MSEPVLKVEHLKKHFQTAQGTVHAVDDVSFDIYRNQTLGLVGESGCGKSTTGRLIVKLLKPTDGRIIYEGTDYASVSGRKAKELRRAVQIIFQDPFSSLDPTKTVMQAISEPIIANKIISGKQKIESRVLELMDTVGLTERLVNTYPHELDGGRRQRIGIARALAMEPKFIVCDEPVSALDVSIQAQILNLLKTLQKNLGLTLLFITHDLAVVNHVSDEIAVMYLGKIVEKADTENLFDHPLHPYTKALLSAIPIPDVGQKRSRIILKGEIASPIDPPDECRFYRRCPEAQDVCKRSMPLLVEAQPGHYVACHLIGA
ncbi:MAG: ABC transporter ATP-binding protein [Christensenellales bacterium]|jgi:peptide/nickel transport system ATP-binding protein